MLLSRPSVRPLMRLADSVPHVAAQIRMQSEKEEVACVTDRAGEVIGLLYVRDLIEPLFRTT